MPERSKRRVAGAAALMTITLVAASGQPSAHGADSENAPREANAANPAEVLKSPPAGAAPGAPASPGPSADDPLVSASGISFAPVNIACPKTEMPQWRATFRMPRLSKEESENTRMRRATVSAHFFTPEESKRALETPGGTRNGLLGAITQYGKVVRAAKVDDFKALFLPEQRAMVDAMLANPEGRKVFDEQIGGTAPAEILLVLHHDGMLVAYIRAGHGHILPLLYRNIAGEYLLGDMNSLKLSPETHNLISGVASFLEKNAPEQLIVK